MYILFFLERIKNIIRKANLVEPIDETVKKMSYLKLSHVKELRLAKKLVKIAEVIFQVSVDLYPKTLCSYMYQLCLTFCEFYEGCKCFKKVRQEHGEPQLTLIIERVILCETTIRVLVRCLELLGIESSQTI